MKIFLSSLEGVSARKRDGGQSLAEIMVRKGIKLKWNLMSYYYIRNKKTLKLAEYIRDNSEEVIIDSGAHSLRHGKEYLEVIKES